MVCGAEVDEDGIEHILLDTSLGNSFPESSAMLLCGRVHCYTAEVWKLQVYLLEQSFILQSNQYSLKWL